MGNQAERRIEWRSKKTWKTMHPRGFFQMEVSCHSEITPEMRKAMPPEALKFIPPRVWNTYLEITDHKKMFQGGICESPVIDYVAEHPESVENLPWHGGITMQEQSVVTEDALRSLIVGDDYAHSFDEGRWDDYTLEQMQANILAIGDAFMEILDAAGVTTTDSKEATHGH